jgi:hypothetical protein
MKLQRIRMPDIAEQPQPDSNGADDVAVPNAELHRGLVRVYEYGCGRNAVSGMELALEQMFRRNELWNRIVEIDNDVRTKMEAALSAGTQEAELRILRDQQKALRAQLAAIRGDRTTTKPRIEEMQERVRTSAAKVRQVLDAVKKARKANAQLNRALMRDLDAERVSRVREAVADAGLYWCSRMEINGHYRVARARAMREGKRLQPRVWDGTGTVCVYFQKGLAVNAVFGSNGRLQVDPVSEDAWKSPSRSVRRHAAWTRVRMRIGAHADLSPVWLEFPISMHRPLPDGGEIRSASIVRERIGLSFRHRLLITVRLPKPLGDSRPAAAVGIDAGWRITPNGLRVAYWFGSDGTHGELVLPRSDLQAFRQIDSLNNTIRTAYLNTRSILQSLIDRDVLPRPVASMISAALSTHSPRTLVEIFDSWKRNRTPGDEVAYATVSAWLKQHVHLWTWQANQRDQLIRRRREAYRRFAANLAARFGLALLHDIPLQRITSRPPIVPAATAAARRYRFMAAVSVLYTTLQHTFERQGGTAVRTKVDGATLTCHACRTMDAWDPAATLTHTCSNCGVTWDQDYNAAINVLQGGLVTVKGDLQSNS